MESIYIITGTLGVIAISGVALYPAFKVMPYVYGVSRIRSAKSKLFKKNELMNLAGESYKDIIYHLEKKGITHMINLINEDFREELVQKRLHQEYVNNLIKIVNYVPTKFKPFFKTLIMKMDLEFMLAIFRSKSNEEFQDRHIIKEMFAETNLFKKNILDEISNMSLDDLIILFKKTIFKDLINKYSEKIKNGDLLEFEQEAHKFYFLKLKKNALDNVCLRKYVKLVVDIYNIKHALCFKDKFYINLGFFNKHQLESLSDAKEKQEIISLLEKTYFNEFIKGKEHTIDILKSTFIAKQKLANRFSKQEPFGINQILSFYIQKKIELRNIAILLKLTNENFEPNKIRGVLI